MLKRCKICNQPITNTPYHASSGNKDRCAKHCNCATCLPPEESTQRAEEAADNEGLAPILTVLSVEAISDSLSSTPDGPSIDVPSDAPPHRLAISWSTFLNKKKGGPDG